MAANVPIYTDQGGKRMVIGEGGTLVIEGDLEVSGGGEIVPGPDSITTAMIQDEAVTFAKTLAFISTQQTGTGSPQNIAHGLGVTPAAVLVVPSDTTALGIIASGYSNTHTKNNTNVVVTATEGLKYYVMAWA